MKKYEWNEEEIEILLRQMPHFKDKRSKERLYQRISFNARKKRRKAWLIPSIASAAAILLVVVIGSSLFPDVRNNMTMEKHEDRAVENSEELSKIQSDLSPFEGVEEHEMPTGGSLVVSETQLEKQDKVVFGIPDKNANLIIPVSVLVDKDGKTISEQIEIAKASLNEQQWGLSDNIFETVTITVDGEQRGTWNINVPSEHHVFSSGSSMEEAFIKGIEEMMYWADVETANLYTDGKQGLSLPNSGFVDKISLTESGKLENGGKKRGYVLYQLDESRPVFLTPTTVSFNHIQEAFDLMNNKHEYPLKPSIPAEIKIQSVKIESDHVTIHFPDDTALPDTLETKWMIEAILLTAKEFGFKSVIFTSKTVDQIGEYPFNKKIVVPVAPNPMQ